MSDEKFIKLQETIKSFLPQPVDEGASRSLSRVMDHIKNRNVGLISANRQSADPETNNKSHEALKNDIKTHGFGYTHVKGTYPEKQSDGSIKHGEERSFLITAPPEKSKHLHKFLMKHGAKYDQDSVLFKGHDEDEAHLHTTVQRTKDDAPVGSKFGVGKFHANQMKDYMTRIKGKKSFTFESVVVEWHDGWLGEWKKSVSEKGQ